LNRFNKTHECCYRPRTSVNRENAVGNVTEGHKAKISGVQRQSREDGPRPPLVRGAPRLDRFAGSGIRKRVPRQPV